MEVYIDGVPYLYTSDISSLKEDKIPILHIFMKNIENRLIKETFNVRDDYLTILEVYGHM